MTTERVKRLDEAQEMMKRAYADLEPGDMPALGAKRATTKGYHGETVRIIDPFTGQAEEAPGSGSGQSPPTLRILSADNLLDREWPEPVWVVPGLLPVGLTLLAGKPKVGKSWLALQLVYSVAAGGMALGEDVEQARCLYLALEDSERRLQGRMVAQGWERRGLPADFVTLGEARDVLPLNGKKAGAVILGDTIREGRYRLVVIDTLSRAVAGDQNAAEVMTAALEPLQEAAHAYEAAVLLVDHHNKLAGATGYLGGDGEPAYDPILNVLGSTAKAALADTVWGIYKRQGKAGAILALVGRDVEERRLSLRWDQLTKCWQNDGDADQVRLTTSRQEILDALGSLGEVPAKTVAEAVGRDRGNTSRRLQDLVSAGLVTCREVAGIPVYGLVVKDLQTEVGTQPTQVHS